MPTDEPKIAAASATRVIDRSAERVLLVRRAQLEVINGPDEHQIEIVADPVVVGCDPDCDLVLSDPAVSAQHFCLQATSKGFYLRDLDSTNGTFCGGVQVEAAYLSRTATIKLGCTQLHFAASDEEVAFPLSKRTRFGELLGHSDVMRAMFVLLGRVAENSDTTLLIEGESGTGKDLAARAVHQRSTRKDCPFLVVDCGAIPAETIESELFGHCEGAFTGATDDRIGPFEQAEGGTLFLDEVGELPLELQPKLLRVLETRQVRRLGETVARSFDARLIAATNRNLAREVEAGRFRRDLYYRLSVIRARMPALRERPEEIPRLVSHFLVQMKQDPSQLPESINEAFAHHRWPGNVRELRNVVQRLALLPGMSAEYYLENAPATSSDSSPELPLDLSFHEGKQRYVERFERRYLAYMMDRCQGNIAEMVRTTGLSRPSCYRLLKRHGIG